MGDGGREEVDIARWRKIYAFVTERRINMKRIKPQNSDEMRLKESL